MKTITPAVNDAITLAVSGNAISNGSMVFSTQDTGHYERISPDINHYMSSGAFYAHVNARFLQQYEYVVTSG